MGKNLQNANLVQRTGKLAFYRVPNKDKYIRMEGFTELTNSKNPKEYSRQYVDEDFERTDVTGYASSISYAFDRYKGNAVLDDIIDITENEYIGEKMIREILVVDMTTASTVDGIIWTASAKKRTYAVVPDTDGDTTDCMTYSGNFKVRGASEDYIVSSDDDWQTIRKSTLKLKGGFAKISVLVDNEIIATNEDGSTQVHTEIPKNTQVTLKIEALTDGASITLYKTQPNGINWKIDSGTTSITNTTNTIDEGKNHFYVLVVAEDQQIGYEIHINGTVASSVSTYNYEET